MNFRVGFGYDIHPLVQGRPLILCGVEIPFAKGLGGHSDADVALHALIDAFLGATALGDIGQHFPDTDEQYKGISSLFLLEKTWQLIIRQGFFLGNIDLTIIAERPKLAPYIPEMKKNIAHILQASPKAISIKAKTNEKMGPCGREEAISAYAIVLLGDKGGNNG